MYLYSHSITRTTGSVSNHLFFCTYWLSHHFFIYKLTHDIPGLKCQKPGSLTNLFYGLAVSRQCPQFLVKPDSLIFAASISGWGNGVCVWHQYCCVCQKHNNRCTLKWGSMIYFKYGGAGGVLTIMPAQPRVTSCGERKNQWESGRERIPKWEQTPNISQCAATSPEVHCIQ